jgi:hypothetical protein
LGLLSRASQQLDVAVTAVTAKRAWLADAVALVMDRLAELAATRGEGDDVVASAHAIAAALDAALDVPLDVATRGAHVLPDGAAALARLRALGADVDAAVAAAAAEVKAAADE